MILLKGLFIVIGLLALTAVSISIFVISTENQQASKNQKQLDEILVAKQPPPRTAVIVFSRSGNTAVAGKHFAKKYNADFYRLESPDYKLGLKGWINALLDARKNESVITPATIELKQYETIFLGSPIWLYSPAPPIWQFAKNNRFDGQQVILFNSYNSQFKQEFIDDFENLVVQKGSVNFKHIAVQRGRMGQQITTEQMIQLFEEQLERP